MKKLVCLMMVLSFCAIAQAVTVDTVTGVYFDATIDNTWATDVSSFPNLDDWSYVTPTNVVYNKWYRKTGSTSAIDGTAFQGEGPTLPQLTTTVAADPSKSYDVYVVFHARNIGGTWFIYAGLPGDDLVLYDETNASYILGEGTLISCQTKLGTVSGLSSISINVNGPASQTNGGQRAWYDGVALVEVPEPATVLFLGVGGFFAMIRKRK